MKTLEDVRDLHASPGTAPLDFLLTMYLSLLATYTGYIRVLAVLGRVPPPLWRGGGLEEKKTSINISKRKIHQHNRTSKTFHTSMITETHSSTHLHHTENVFLADTPMCQGGPSLIAVSDIKSSVTPRTGVRSPWTFLLRRNSSRVSVPSRGVS